MKNGLFLLKAEANRFFDNQTPLDGNKRCNTCENGYCFGYALQQ
jgi:hypothetical protein